MQELVLNALQRTLEEDTARQAERAGLREEFELRLSECGPLAFRVALGVLRNPTDAEDVAQDTLLRAYRKFAALRDPARLRSWIVRIAFRLALDRWRSAKRREVRETAWSEPVYSGTLPSAEDLAASGELQARLQRALNQLPDKFRLVLILSAIQGYTLEEVSRLLEIPTSTVKSRLFFARKQLEAEMNCQAVQTKITASLAAGASELPDQISTHREHCPAQPSMKHSANCSPRLTPHCITW